MMISASAHQSHQSSTLLLIIGLILATEPCYSFLPAGGPVQSRLAQSSQVSSARASTSTSSALFSATQNYTFGIDGFLMQEEENYKEEMRRHDSSSEEKRWQEARRLAEEARLQGQQLRGGHNARWLAERQSYQSGYPASSSSSQRSSESDSYPQAARGGGYHESEEVDRIKADYTQQLAEQARRQGQVLDGGIFDNNSPGTSRLKERQQQQAKQAQEAARIAEEQRLAQAQMEEEQRRQTELAARRIQDLNHRGPQQQQQVLMNGGGLDRESSAARPKPMTPEERRVAQEAMEEERRRAEAARIYEELQIEHELKTQRLQEEIEYCQKLSLDELKQEVEERGIPGSFYQRWEYVLAVAKARDAEGYVQVSDVEVLTDDEVEIEATEAHVSPGTSSSKAYPSQGPTPGSSVQRESPISPPYSYSYSREGAADGRRGYEWESYSYTYPSTEGPSQPSARFSYESSNPAPNQREATYRWEYSTPGVTYTDPTSPQGAFNSPYSTRGGAGERNSPHTSPFSNPVTSGATPSQQQSSAHSPYSKQQQRADFNRASRDPVPSRQESAFNAPYSQGSQGAAAATTTPHGANTNQQVHHQRASGAGSPVQPYTPHFSGSLERGSSGQARQQEVVRPGSSKPAQQRVEGGGGSASNFEVLVQNDRNDVPHPYQAYSKERWHQTSSSSVQELRSHRPAGSHYVTYDE